MMKQIAVVPSYEPDEYLALTVSQLLDNGIEVVVIDDGSGAEYRKFFDALPPQVHQISYPVNQGKGYALKQGFAYVKDHYGEDCVAVTVDSDGQHGIADVLRVLAKVEDAPESLVMGSRYLEKSAPLRSRFGNATTRLVFRFATGVSVHDTQTGLRAFSGSMMPRLCKIPGNRYEYEMNMLLEFAHDRIPIHELRIQTIYLDENSRSHFHALKDSFRIYKDILKFAASSFIGFLTDYVVFSLLLLCTGGHIVWSNVGARIVSSIVNYTINRNVVFRNKGSILKSAFFYFLLAIGILIGNTLVLSLLVNILGINSLLAKLITEVLFFTVSWLVQRLFIFKV